MAGKRFSAEQIIIKLREAEEGWPKDRGWDRCRSRWG